MEFFFNFLIFFFSFKKREHNLPHRLDTRILNQYELDQVAKRFYRNRLTAIFVSMIGAAILNTIVPNAAGKRGCD
jgi:hypothetical protein